MPWGTVKLIPGSNSELTPTYNRAGYVHTALGRFKAGVFQKIGGWLKFFNGVISGVPKALHAWQDLNEVKRLAVGSTTTVTVLTPAGLPTIITPQTLDTDPSLDFTTTMGSATVEIVDDQLTDSLTLDVSVYFRVPVSIGGIVLSGLYQITRITGADSYEIEALTAATATEANAGTVPEFTTTSGSASINVELVDHGQIVGNIVVFDEPTTVGGVIVQGKYTVTTVVDADNFTITGGSSASSNDTVMMNSGDAGFTYYIALGPLPAGVGFGLGGYGDGGYGLGTSGTGVQTGTPITATDWTLDNWGEILFACPERGGIYYWQPNTGFQNLKLIGTGPLFNKGMFASMGQQQIIAFGSSIDARIGGGIGIYRDPLLLQWCDVGNFLTWMPTAANFARNYRIGTGSEIIAGAATKNRNLIWTDLGVWSMVWNGSQSAYSINNVGGNCGIVGMHAWCVSGDTVFWMGKGNFFAYAGSGVQPVPCTVWDDVFQDLDTTNQHKCQAGSNTDFTEVWFFYPSIQDGTGECSRFAKYNTVEQTWDIGPMARAAWIDRSVLGNPIAITPSGIIYYHEMGNDDDNNALVPEMLTGDFMIDEGEDFAFIDEIIPDFRWGLKNGTSQDAQINITLYVRDNPGEEAREYGPFLVTKDSPSFCPASAIDFTRPRGRLAQLEVSSSDVGSFWRLGAVRFRYAPDGRNG
jgi:hypothetical protein